MNTLELLFELRKKTTKSKHFTPKKVVVLINSTSRLDNNKGLNRWYIENTQYDSEQK